MNEEVWIKLREKYDKMIEKKKEKHQKLMDIFELSLNKHIKKQKEENNLGSFSFKLTK